VIGRRKTPWTGDTTHQASVARKNKKEKPMKPSFPLLLCIFGLAVPALIPAQSPPVLQRVSNTTLRMPPVPQTRGYKTELAFGNLFFTTPVAIRTPSGETNRLFVVEQGGRIYAITNLTAPNKTLFLDLSSRILAGDLTGSFALAFHPGYATNGNFYVGYNLSTQTEAGTGTHFRISRFSASADDPNLASLNSELPLITQYYVGSSMCDDLLFGSDGYLYAALADPKAPSGGTLQAIDGNLYGGILRIDVDKKPGNLTPNPHPAVTTNYAIPFDNPFVGVTNFNGSPVDPAGARTEFYAVGLRNPWRMSFDELSGLLYVGDPGHSLRDEINIVVKGGNYGWPYREGTGAGPQSSKTPPQFTSINPIHQYGNPSAVIGGVVYRGQRYPQLQGAFVFGDYVKGQVYALRYEGTNLVPAQTLTAQAGTVSFGLDPGNGDVLVVDRNSWRIMRLTYSPVLIGAPLPPTLADTGAFADHSTLTPNAGVVGYDLNVSFWSDNARKTRWFSVPDITKTFDFSRDGNWSFPAGTVWIKHFELELTNGVPESARRIETRLLVRTATGVYGVTYRWGDSLTNAVLVPEDGMDETFTVQDGGVVRPQVWHYPSRSECLTCHTPVAGHALGFTTAQLNRDFDYGGGTQNQIRALSEAGYFHTTPSEFHPLPALAHPTNAAVSLDFRVRSYLAANCVQCHQPGGAALGHFDTRLTTPLSASGLMDGLLVDSLGDFENRVIKPASPEHSALLTRIANLGANHMPPLATSILDQQAIDLLRAWITGSATNYQSYADWQQSHFGSASAPGSAPAEDADGDGANNQLEYLSGTNPLLAGDAWKLSVTITGESAEIQIPRIANRHLEVQWTANPAVPTSWRPLDVPGNEPVFAPTSSVVKLRDTLTDAARFYRVRVIEP
jgi:glucose/arabinose dehydrogenase